MNFSKYLILILTFAFFGIVFSFFRLGNAEINLISMNIDSSGIIRLSFDEPQATSVFEERFKIKPDVPVDFIWSPSKKELAIVPLTLLENNRIYDLRFQRFPEISAKFFLPILFLI